MGVAADHPHGDAAHVYNHTDQSDERGSVEHRCPPNPCGCPERGGGA